MDPAGPGYERSNEAERLQATDADFVDVIHTDGYDPNWTDVTDYFMNHFGTLIPLGDIDFYPNYGIARQPGCG